jgi:hypothetical protein
MSKFSITQAPRFAAGLVLVAAMAAVPMSAQAADTPVTGTLTGGTLTNTAPTIAPFAATLTGATQTVPTDVGAWGVTDATGGNAGYNITASATAPAVGGVAAAAGTGATLSLLPSTAAPAAGNPNTQADAPVAAAQQEITAGAVTIQSAAADTGQGAWDFPAVPNGLEAVIPGDASAGAYTSTVTYTAAPPAA